MPGHGGVTELLERFNAGEHSALDGLIPLVYADLREIAHRQRRRERPGHTLNTTALVHEAYFKLIQFDRMEWKDREHFYAIAAQAMRRILVDHAVRRSAQKRGGGHTRVPLDDDLAISEEQADDLLALDEALRRLAKISERQSKVVECRFFGGLTIADTAAALNSSPATVKRDWSIARAWLNREITTILGVS